MRRRVREGWASEGPAVARVSTFRRATAAFKFELLSRPRVELSVSERFKASSSVE